MFTKLHDSLSPNDILKLLTKMASMNYLEQQEYKRRLNEPAKILSFDCGELVEKIGNLEIYDATANAVKAYFNGFCLSERKTTFSVSIIKDTNGIFEFITQSGGNECHLLTCHVKKKHQGKNKSKEMVKAIKDICFNKGYNKVHLRSGESRIDEGVASKGDWRKTIVKFNGRTMTALEKFWFKQEDVFPLTDFDSSADEDRFVIIPNKDS